MIYTNQEPEKTEPNKDTQMFENIDQYVFQKRWHKLQVFHQKIKLDEYNKWIRDNNIDKNIDLTQAKFTPGRHPLSTEFISHPHIKDPKTFYNEIIKITPLIKKR